MEIAQEIVQKAASYRDFTAKNLSEMVKIPSLSGEEAEVVEAIGAMCDKAGFDEVRVDGFGNLIGRVGSGKRVLAVDAHIDTVDTGDPSQWDLDPFSGEIDAEWVYGRGTVDQEGGAASMITAGRILKEMGWDGDITVYFTFTIMEEDCDGLCWIYLIEQEKIKPDFAVITEPTNLRITRGHRGRMEIEVFLKGVSAHGSAPERGENAVYKAAEGILAVRDLAGRLKEDAFLGKGTVAVTRVRSESPSLCAIPDRSDFYLDRRLTWGETLESAVKEVEDALGGAGDVKVPLYERESYRGTVYPQDKYFPTWKIPEDHPLVGAGVETAELLFGSPPEVDKWTFSTNGVALCGRFDVPCIGFGPGDESYAHGPNEKIEIDHLEKASAFYALLPYVLERRNV